jgi:tetratricopeptide (TPR) repeat protein
MKTAILKIFCFVVCFLLTSKNALAINTTNELSAGCSDYRQGDYESALAHFNQTLSIDTNNMLALISRGACYRQLKRYGEAEHDLNTAVETSTNNIALSLSLSNRGYFYAEITNFDNAIEDYSKAIQYNPSSSMAYIGRAYAEIAKGEYTAAMPDCNMAVMLDPDSADPYDFRGRIFLQMGKYDRCIADYSKAIEINTNSILYYLQRSQAFAGKEDITSAISDYGNILRLAGNDFSLMANAYGCRGLCFSKIGQFAKGIQDCKKGVETDTNSEICLNNLAWLLSIAPDTKLRNGKLAVEYATRACKISNWKDPYAVGTLAAAYAEIGNFDEAVKWEKKAILIGFPLKENEQAHRELDLFEQKHPYHAKK